MFEDRSRGVQAVVARYKIPLVTLISGRHLKYTRLNLFIPFKINPFWLTILRFVSARCRLPF